MLNSQMTGKERILCAMRGGQPDRVPVQLGIMTIAPRYANAPGWEVYFHGKHALREMMAMMVAEFGFDGYDFGPGPLRRHKALGKY